MVKVRLEKHCYCSPNSGADWTGYLRLGAYKIIEMPTPPDRGMNIRISDDETYRVEQLYFDAENNYYIALHYPPHVSMGCSFEQYYTYVRHALSVYVEKLKECEKGEWCIEYGWVEVHFKDGKPNPYGLAAVKE